MNILKHIPVIIIIIALLAIAGCGPGENEMSTLNTHIEDITGGAFEVPLHDDYPLIYAYLRKPPVEIDNGLYFNILRYSIDDVELVKVYEDEAMIKEVEESQEITILYGPYKGTSPIMIECSPIFKDAEQPGADETGSWNISGQKVDYAFTERQGREVMQAYLILNETGVIATYFLSDIFTEKDAKELTAYLVNEM